MSNVFITQLFDWDRPDSRKARLLRRVLGWLGYRVRLAVPEQTGEMSSVEQRINMYHLLSQVLAFGVPGSVIEIGCREGSSAVVFQKVIDQYAPDRFLEVFDGFFENPPEHLLAHFQRYRLRPPVVHVGRFEETLPDRLPDRICFAHVDVGVGGAAATMEGLLRRCLEAIYPRLAPGAICLLADYCDPDVYKREGFSFPHCVPFADRWHLHPQVKLACDAFLCDKPERVCVLYGGEFSHAFFRKR
jgi:O-methyltransferase